MVASYIDSYYARTATETAARQPLADTVDVDVCVVGGGLAGLSATLGLAERGHSVALIEAHRVGWGASGRNGGFVGAGFSPPPRKIAAKVGLDQARALHRLSRDGLEQVRRRIKDHAIDCGPNTEGSLSASWFNDADDLRRWRDDMAETFDERYDFWPRERVREALISERYYDALFKPDAFQFHPLNYCLGLARAAEARGALIFEQSPAVAHDLDGAVKTVTVAGGGQIRAREVLFACGGYIDGLHRRLSAAIVPVATYVIVTEPLGERIETAIRVPYTISDTRFALDYYRRLPDSRILWGGRISIRRQPPALDRLMLGDLLKVYPQLKGVAVETAWSGLMSYAVHKMPQIGRLSPGVWYAMGFGGHGMNTAPMAGELIVAAIAEGDDRYRLFAPFGLTPTGGPLGAAAAQISYWFYALSDALRASFKHA